MSEKKKTKYDMNSPEAKALIDEIVHGTFMKEGTMAAFPTCFPGASIPIPADESHITALDVSGDGMIYGGTSGRATHLFVGDISRGHGRGLRPGNGRRGEPLRRGLLREIEVRGLRQRARRRARGGRRI